MNEREELVPVIWCLVSLFTVVYNLAEMTLISSVWQYLVNTLNTLNPPQPVFHVSSSPSKILQGSFDSTRIDDEHRLIARYAARLAADANNAVSFSLVHLFLCCWVFMCDFYIIIAMKVPFISYRCNK